LIFKHFQIEDNEGNAKETDEELNSMLRGQKDIREYIKKLDETIETTCKKTCKHQNSRNSMAKVKSVPWWTDALKIMRKRTNALRRRYQRTLSNEELRKIRKNEYTKTKTKYQAAITKDKTNPWKQYRTATSPINPWNEMYILASGKTRNKTTLTTLQKPDGSKTANMTEDNVQDVTVHHKNVRRLTEQPIETTDDKEFTQDEVRQIIESFKPGKTSGPDGITSEILKLVFKSIPKTLTSIYNVCLKMGASPKIGK